MGAEDHVCGNKRRSDCTVQKSAAPSERQGRTDPDRKWMRRSDQRERRTVRRGRHGRSEGTV